MMGWVVYSCVVIRLQGVNIVRVQVPRVLPVQQGTLLAQARVQGVTL